MSADTETYTVLRLPAVAASAATVRRVVASTLEAWGRDDLVEDATLCAGELAANALLHARGAYDLTVRRAGAGVRVEVIDDRPGEWPIVVPTSGSAIDVTEVAVTGRGLVIVGALANRWGFTTTTVAKSVWAEVEGDRSPRNGGPVVVIDHAGLAAPGPVTIGLRSMPVRVAVASGVQVEELIREIQLQPEGVVGATDRKRFYELLDTSAHPRLAGRYAALRAAGEGGARFDLELHTTLDAIGALGELNGLLVRLSMLVGDGAAVPASVVAFRAWLATEVASQLAGGEPEMCPLAH